jgi:4-amino-4-deoxy-L-arabinose transferase-like glycosyltransferase
MKDKIFNFLDKYSNNIFFGLVVAFILRLIAIYYYLPMINQDELTIIYDAKSIVETGTDRWQSPNNLIYHSLGTGDNRPPLLFWIFALGHYLFGLDTFGFRIINIFIGLGSLLLIYEIGKKLINKTFGKYFFWTMVFAPIHILSSGQAFETTSINYTTMLLGLYFWLKYYESNGIKWLIAVAVSFGVSVYAYQAPKLIAPLIILFISLFLVKNKKYSHILYLYLSAFIIVIPQIYVLFKYPAMFAGRAANTVPSKLKVVDYIFTFFNNPIISLFDIKHWFLASPIFEHNCNIFFLFLQFPFFIFGIFLFFVKREFVKPSFYWAIIGVYWLGSFAEAITFTNVNFLRNPYLMFYIGFFVSIGLYYFSNHIKLISSILFISFIVQFSFSYNQDTRFYGFQDNLVRLYTKLKKYNNNNTPIIIEQFGNMPYVYLLYYSGISPKEFQMSKKVIDSSICWDRIDQIGRYYYRNQNFIRDSTLPVAHGLLVTQIDTNLKKIDSVDQFKFYQF